MGRKRRNRRWWQTKRARWAFRLGAAITLVVGCPLLPDPWNRACAAMRAFFGG